VLGFGIGGVAVAAAVVALAVGMSQAVGTRACAAVLPAGQAQQAGEVSGIATHYVLQSLPNCSYPSPPADGLFVALSPGEYDNAAACGGYLEVHGPDGSVRVEVIDQCPGCGAGHIDLSEAALLAMNTGNPLASVQVQSESGGGWHNLVQASYNYWVAQSGAGAGPFTVRLTDTQGHVATVQDVALSPGVTQGTGTWMYGAGATTGPALVPASTPPSAPRTTRPVASATSAHLFSRAAGELNAEPETRLQTSPPSPTPTC
jgi:hypothetical protein